MRNIVIILSAIALFSCKPSTNQTINDLPKPIMTGGKPFMLTLHDRHTTRDFSEKELNPQIISNLLWAANGINRPQNGGRTAPSAMNKQEIDVYVALKSGVYLFEAKNHKLNKVIDEDIRSFVGEQKFHKVAPISLILVADYNKTKNKDTDSINKSCSPMNAAYVSENIYLFCSSENLATVAVGWLHYDLLHQKLKLSKNQEVMLAHPVGYMK